MDVRPRVATEAVGADADDPAVWIHPTDPGRSLVFGTNKVAAPEGALVVFGLDGKKRQTVAGIDRPNNVDVEYGLTVGGRRTDIAVLTERLKQRLRVFRIAADGSGVTEMGAGGLPVFAGTPEKGAGLAYMAGPTGGYLIGFVLAAALCGWIAERRRDLTGLTLAVVAGSIAIYLPGVLWLARFVGFDKALDLGLMPFLWGDVLKAGLAVALAAGGAALVRRRLGV